MSKRFKHKAITIALVLSLFTSAAVGYLKVAEQPFLQSARVGDALALSLDYPESLLCQLRVDIKDDEGVLGLEEDATM